MANETVRPLIIAEAEIARVAPSCREIIEIVEETYRLDGEGGAEVPSKIGVHPDYKNSFLHAMPAWVPGRRALGMKWVSYFPGNFARGLPDSTGIIVLNDPDHGLPVAIMEGMWITYARTSACAAVMARHLCNPQPQVLALVGCGGLGYWSLLMLGDEFASLKEVRVSSRTPESRAAFCERMAEHGDWRLIAVETPRDAVTGADIVVSSIPPPPAPFIEPDWLHPGMLALPLDYFHCYTSEAIGAFSAIVTDDCDRIRRVLSEKPTAVAALKGFGEIVAGRTSLERRKGDRLMGLPTGIASTDMTVAWEIYRRVRKAGLGAEIALTQ